MMLLPILDPSGGSGRGNQWLGAFSAPIHPAGIVSSRQRETRMIPAVPTCASNMRIFVPSFGAVLIGCHWENTARPPLMPLTWAVG
jgi:hypothetical protein